MYAVIKSGGKQYKVAAGNVIAVAKLAGEAGDTISFDEVLLVGDDSEPTLGSPLVAGAAVAGEIVGQERTAKILVFKKRRRQNSKRSRGHRQDQTLVRITEILTEGRKPEAKAKPNAKPADEASASAAPETTAEAETTPRRSAKAEGAAKAPRARKAEETASDEKPARKPRPKAAKNEDNE